MSFRSLVFTDIHHFKESPIKYGGNMAYQGTSLKKQRRQRLQQWQDTNTKLFNHIRFKGGRLKKVHIQGNVASSKECTCFVALGRVTIFKQFNHASTVKFELFSDAGQFEPLEHEVVWIQDQTLNICRHLYKECSGLMKSFEYDCHVTKIALIRVNLDSCEVATEEVLTFNVQEDKFNKILERGHLFSFGRPDQFLQSHTDPAYALGKLVSLAHTHAEKEGFSTDAKSCLTCSSSGRLTLCTINDEVETWSIKSHNSKCGSVHLSDKYAILITDTGTLYIYSARNGSYLRMLHPLKNHNREIAHPHVRCIVSRDRAFLGLTKVDHMSVSCTVDLKTLKFHSGTFRCRPRMTCYSDDLLLLSTFHWGRINHKYSVNNDHIIYFCTFLQEVKRISG